VPLRGSQKSEVRGQKCFIVRVSTSSKLVSYFCRAALADILTLLDEYRDTL
jgi:hypothetical protein